MSDAMMGAILVTLVSGIGVYRSCTRYADTLRQSLAIDVIGMAGLIIALHFMGVW